MEMPNNHGFIFFLSFILHVTSSLYLRDYRPQKLRTFVDRRNERLSRIQPKIQKFDVSRRMQGTGPRWNEKINHSRKNETIGTWITCVIKVNGENQLDHDCEHSANMKINWTREDGRLVGTFSTNFHCPQRRDVRNKMQSPWNKVGRKWKQVIREKRRTVYRDDDETENARNEEAQQIDKEEDVAPEVDQHGIKGEDGFESSRGKVPDEDDKERTNEHTEDDEIQDEGQKEVDIASNSAGESVENKEDPGEEHVVEGENEVNQVEKEDDDKADIVDKVALVNKTSENGDGDDEGNQEKIENVPDAENSVDTEESIKKTPAKNDNGVKNSVNDTRGAVGDFISEVVSDVQSGIQSILHPVEVNRPLIALQLALATYLADRVINGEYIIASLVKNLKQRLRQQRIHEKFDHKVEMLAKIDGSDADKALLILKNKINEQLGKSYQLRIVEYLKQLYESFNP